MGFPHTADQAPSPIRGRRFCLWAAHGPWLCLLIVLAALAAQPAAAQSIFDLLADGPREQPGSDVVRCDAITLQFRFYDNNRRMALTYTDDIIDYEGNARRRGDYDVLAVEDSALLLQLDGESRRDAAGDPVMWRLRLAQNGVTCWQRSDDGPLSCYGYTAPCPGQVPLS